MPNHCWHRAGKLFTATPIATIVRTAESVKYPLRVCGGGGGGGGKGTLCSFGLTLARNAFSAELNYLNGPRNAASVKWKMVNMPVYDGVNERSGGILVGI